MLYRYGPPKFWARNDAEGTWDISEDWPPALPEPPGGQLAAGAPASASAAVEGTGSAAESESGSCVPDIDETLFAQVHMPMSSKTTPMASALSSGVVERVGVVTTSI